MRKVSSEQIPCTYCEKQALPNTDPPVCEEHEKLKKSATDEEQKTLKELEAEHA